MSKIDWGIGTAAVIAVVVFSWWGINGLAEYHDNNNERYREISNQKVSKPPSYVCNFRSTPISVSCSPVTTDSADSTDDAVKYDLNVQQDMALAAFGVLFVACAGLIISGVTIFFVIRAINETRQTNKITREIGQAQTQAYVHATDACFLWGGRSKSGPHVEIWIGAIGQTPPKWYEVRAQYLIKERSCSEDLIIPWTSLSDADCIGRWGGLAPGGKPRRVRLYVSKMEVSSDTKLYVFGEIRYRTLFDETFVSQFCYIRVGIPDFEAIAPGDETFKPAHSSEKPHYMMGVVRNALMYEKIDE